MKGSTQRKRGNFEKRRESVTIGRGLVCKHVSENGKSLVVVVNVIGTDEGIVEKSRYPWKGY